MTFTHIFLDFHFLPLDNIKEIIKTAKKDKKITLDIYPYSNLVLSRQMFDMAMHILDPSKHQSVSSNFDEHSSDTINTLVSQLKKVNDTKFPTTNEVNFRMWASYIDCFGVHEHERLINENPPTQLMPFFDPNFYEVIVTEEPESNAKYAVKFLTRVKQAKSDQNFIFVGDLTVKGDTLEEVKIRIWEIVRQHVVREVIFNENDFPSWHSTVTPTIDDLHKFVTIYDPKRKVLFKFESPEEKKTSADSLLERWSKASSLQLNIFPFTLSVSNNERLTKLKSYLEPNTATRNLIDKLQYAQSENFISSDLNWRMWAHYIQGNQNEQQVYQNPPSELAHLFPRLSLQNSYKNLVRERKSDETDTTSNLTTHHVFEQLYLSDEDVQDKTKVQQSGVKESTEAALQSHNNFGELNHAISKCFLESFRN